MAFHGLRGMYISPKGQRFSGAIRSIAARAPLNGNGFALWGGLFATFDCALTSVRGRDDMWNPILAGGFTGAALAARAGKRAMVNNFAVGAVLLAAIEGLNHFITKMTSGGAQENALVQSMDKAEKQKHKQRIKLNADPAATGSMLSDSTTINFGSFVSPTYSVVKTGFGSRDYTFSRDFVENRL